MYVGIGLPPCARSRLPPLASAVHSAWSPTRSAWRATWGSRPPRRLPLAMNLGQELDGALHAGGSRAREIGGGIRCTTRLEDAEDGPRAHVPRRTAGGQGRAGQRAGLGDRAGHLLSECAPVPLPAVLEANGALRLVRAGRGRGGKEGGLGHGAV